MQCIVLKTPPLPHLGPSLLHSLRLCRVRVELLLGLSLHHGAPVPSHPKFTFLGRSQMFSGEAQSSVGVLCVSVSLSCFSS